MSLRVWLPLNGDLHNQGVSNHTIALTNGNTWTSPGKIGNNALTLTKLQLIVPSTSCMSGAKEISYAYWIKVNTAWSDNWLDGIRWIETDGSATSTARQEFYTNCTLIGTWYKGGAISGKAFTPGVWTHLAGTFNYNTGEAKFYINGVLSGSTTNINTTYYCRGDFCIGDNGVDICENDVRIYDHCLSAAEVREIAQGLILHYKLDDITNDIKDSSGYGHNGNYVNTTNSSDTTRYNASIACIGTTVDNSSNTITGAQFFYCNMDMPATNTITIAWWNKIMKYGRGGIFETSNSIQTNTTKGTDYNTTAFANWDSTFGVYNGSTRVNIFSNFARNGQWHHHAITFDGVNVKYYLDGILKQTSALAGNLPAWKNFCIGLGKAGGVWRQIQQNVSDFRIYCTALSADNILALYHTSAKVDNKQKLHTFELVENQNKISINKKGQVLCKELTENTDTKFYKANQAIDTKQIIEF